jgi:hypothetical protein
MIKNPNKFVMSSYSIFCRRRHCSSSSRKTRSSWGREDLDQKNESSRNPDGPAKRGRTRHAERRSGSNSQEIRSNLTDLKLLTHLRTSLNLLHTLSTCFKYNKMFLSVIFSVTINERDRAARIISSLRGGNTLHNMTNIFESYSRSWTLVWILKERLKKLLS